MISVGSLVGYNSGEIDGLLRDRLCFRAKPMLVASWEKSSGEISDSSATGSDFRTTTVMLAVLWDTKEPPRPSETALATGPVFGSGDDVGGLVGKSEGNIRDSYAMGPVFSGRAGNVGGLVGNQAFESNIKHRRQLRDRFCFRGEKCWWSSGIERRKHKQ